jgi:hypothetical protein
MSADGGGSRSGRSLAVLPAAVAWWGLAYAFELAAASVGAGRGDLVRRASHRQGDDPPDEPN